MSVSLVGFTGIAKEINNVAYWLFIALENMRVYYSFVFYDNRYPGANSTFAAARVFGNDAPLRSPESLSIGLGTHFVRYDVARDV